MHKLIFVIIAFTILLSGCNNDDKNESSFDRCSVSTATSEKAIQSSISKIKQGIYDNISIDDFECEISHTDSIDIIKKSTEEISFNEFYKYFKSIFSVVFNVEYSEENLFFKSDKLSDYTCCAAKLANTHKYINHKDEIDCDKLSVTELLYYDEDNMITLTLPISFNGGSFLIMNKNIIDNLLPEGADLSNWSPTLDETSEKDYVIDYRLDEKKTINFFDGTITVKDLHNKVNDFCGKLNTALSNNNSLEIESSSVYSYGAYSLISTDLKLKYKNINFESVSTDNYVNNFDDKHYNLLLKPRMVMASKNNVSFYIGIIPETKYECSKK